MLDIIKNILKLKRYLCYDVFYRLVFFYRIIGWDFLYIIYILDFRMIN